MVHFQADLRGRLRHTSNTIDPAQHRNLIDDPARAELRHGLAARLAERIHDVEGSRPTVT